MSGRAITTGNRNFLNRESNGNRVARIQAQQQPKTINAMSVLKRRSLVQRRGSLATTP
jgi:hypothetical protein